MTPDQQQIALKRALGYPYQLIHQSFVFQAGKQATHQLVYNSCDFPDVSGRIPVLAVGSNQSPEQLARKFPSIDWGQIPSSRVHLKDFDTVFSAHVTSYGSIASTLFPAPGTCVSLFVNWLDQRQLLAMHETELTNGNYTYSKLKDIQISVDVGPDLTDINFYMGRRGAYVPEGCSIPLAEVPARGRVIGAAKSQTEILFQLHQQLAPELELEQFIISSIENPDRRNTYIETLEKFSYKFESKHLVK